MSAEPGTGTATREHAAISRACNTPIPSTRDLDQEWSWSERYSPQPEILAYANHVADRFDLRRDIRFATRVTSARFDEDAGCWEVETDRGDRVTGWFCIMAVGCLSNANIPDFPGRDEFEGPILHTGHWPHEEVDFTGKRGGGHRHRVIGDTVDPGHRQPGQPAHGVPAHAELLGPGVEPSHGPGTGTRGEGRLPGTPGADAGSPHRLLLSVQRRPGACVDAGGTRAPVRGVLGPRRPAVSRRLRRPALRRRRQRDRGRVRPATRSAPSSGTRPPPNCCARTTCSAASDCASIPDTTKPTTCRMSASSTSPGTPIERFSRDGVVVDGTTWPADVIICATGFAAMTGSFERMEITGRDGLTLAEKWRAGPRTCLGLSTHGFPNLFMITGPGSPSVLASMIQAIEQHVDWMADCMAHMRRHRRTHHRTRGRGRGCMGGPRQRGPPVSRCARPAHPGTSGPTSRDGRGCSCPTSAGFRSTVNRCNEGDGCRLRGVHHHRRRDAIGIARDPPDRTLARPGRHGT